MPKTITLPKLQAKAQDVFNRWVRHRDADKPCISCGKIGNQAGHYLPVKQFGSVRYHPDNCWLQCAYCNCYAHGNQIMYRRNLVARIGEEAVTNLEEYAIANRVKRWSREELMDIIEKYKV